MFQRKNRKVAELQNGRMFSAFSWYDLKNGKHPAFIHYLLPVSMTTESNLFYNLAIFLFTGQRLLPVYERNLLITSSTHSNTSNHT